MIIISKFWTKVLSLGFASAITIYPFIFVRSEWVKFNERTINHERIHLAQQLEIGWIGLWIGIFSTFIWGTWWVCIVGYFLFYIWYLTEFCIRFIGTLRLRHLNMEQKHLIAYYNICFEKEAIKNAENSLYLVNRKNCAFLKYLIK